MKYIYWIFAILIATLFLLYIVLFTSLGNALVKPFVESAINKETGLESKFDNFSLSMDKIDILLELNKNNTLLVKGSYSIFSQSFNIDYAVNLQELNSLQAITKTELHGSFITNGTVAGDMNLFAIEGKSDFAKSATEYSIEMKNLNPTSIIAHIRGLDLATLLYVVNQKQYASADVNLDINFKSIVTHQLDGNVKLETLGGVLNSKVLKNDFNITVPHTEFSMNLDALLKGENINYDYKLNSNLAQITSAGNIVPQPLQVDIDYALDVEELALLKPISGADIRGALKVDGSVTGNKEQMQVTAKSDIASSNTTLLAILKEFQPASIKADIKGLKLEKLLYMVKQPHYADATFDMNVDITNAKAEELSGVVTSKVYKGVLDSKYMTKAYKFESPMPKTKFSATTYTTLNKSDIVSKVTVQSTLADLNIKEAYYNLKTNTIKSDYKVDIHNLAQLYFVTQRELKGTLSATGELNKAKDLDLTMHSNVASGKVDAKLHNDDFHADIKALQTLDILDMLVYPKIFKSSIDATLDYNLLVSKGDFNAKISDGKFTKNQVLDLTKQYAKVDLYKEKFEGTLTALIKKENIVASMDLKSNKSSIRTKNTKLNSKTKRIHSTIDINANGNPLTVKLRGNANSPKVTVDASKIIQKEATKAVKKEIEKRLGKDVDKLFKGLF